MSGLRFLPLCLALAFLPLKTALATEAAETAGLRTQVSYSAAALAPGEAATVHVLVRLEAPKAANQPKRPPVAVSLVLDRSGSMDEARKMNYAKQAAKTLIRSLAEDDLFGLVVYDTVVEELVPMGPVRNKPMLLKLVDSISPDGTTFLSGGLEKGIAQLSARPHSGPSRVLLLSDGLANEGITKVELVAAITAKARNKGISTSSMGLGLDFNEDMMQLLAQRGGGRYYYIKNSEDLPAIFAEEMNLMNSSYTKELRLTFAEAGQGMADFKVFGHSSSRTGKAVDIDVSDLSSGESRQLLLSLKVEPGTASIQQLGSLNITYKNPEDNQPVSQSLELSLPVLADDTARADAEKAQAESTQVVRDEALLLAAEESQLAALEALGKGDMQKAKDILQTQQAALRPAMAAPVFRSKMEQLAAIESQMDELSQNLEMQKSVSKASKYSAYQSAKGMKQGIMLRRGDTGLPVEKLQQALSAKGLYTGPADGVYGDALEKAVTEFQKKEGMNVDGIAGPATLNALGLAAY